MIAGEGSGGGQQNVKLQGRGFSGARVPLNHAAASNHKREHQEKAR